MILIIKEVGTYLPYHLGFARTRNEINTSATKLYTLGSAPCYKAYLQKSIQVDRRNKVK